ncbi:sigma-70 family RNA polymerase sigma factor [uncultured Dysgonomonas sp.]|uniref:Sigma-70, region 4 n=1 Tax=uncultured Dysgonomonas sp. TaxID=206096 RepID=A0A212JUF9_9BACT|nr:sigma-70 family RNA polymerase sigma factor [uncultured Dysgonomonas sp.]SBW03062.1 Sigma-70, region 4 [uncultured Dysgonomonas sp.]
MSDISSLKKFIDGTDPDSGLLYQSYVNSLYRYGISLGFAEDICMDAIHDVFCKLYNLSKENIIKIENVKYYLFKSLKHRLFDIYKKNKFIENVSITSIPFDIEVSVVDPIIDEEDKKIITEKVESLMSCLTDRQKEGIYLRYIQEMNYDEIALLLNMTPKSARMLVFRAMERLRNLNGDEKKIFFILLSASFLKSL